MGQTIIHTFSGVLAIHLRKKGITIPELTGIVFNSLKANPEDLVDKFGLTQDKYEFRRKESQEEILGTEYVLQDGDELIMYCKIEEE